MDLKAQKAVSFVALIIAWAAASLAILASNADTTTTAASTNDTTNISPGANNSAGPNNNDTNVSNSFQAASDTLAMIASFAQQNSELGAILPVPSNNILDYGRHLEKTMHHRRGYNWRLALDGRGAYKLEWTFDYARNRIYFKLAINTTGAEFVEGKDVLAVGFSEDGSFNSSDFCLLWYDLGYRLHLQDARTDSTGKLKLIDEFESICKGQHQWADTEDRAASKQAHSAIAKEQQNIKSFNFERPLDSCESSESKHYVIDNGTTNLVWFHMRGPLAALDELDVNAELSQVKSKNAGGLRRAQLLVSRESPPPAETARKEHLQRYTLTMHDYKVPALETTYACRLFKLARPFQLHKHHITRYEAVIGPEASNSRVVHHMELFDCAEPSLEQLAELDTLVGWTGDCNGAQRPPVTSICKRVMLAWAMGAHPLEYPPNVGQRLGGKGYSPYVLLEVHYNNPRREAAVVDGSGFAFDYTRRLRAYDAGILEVGLEYTDKNSVPPGMLAPLAGHCLGECTRIAMASSASNHRATATTQLAVDDEIHVFAAQMHAHLAGVGSWTELVRGGRLVEELQRDDHYSPHFQEIRMLPKQVRVKPGDALIHYCLYDTRTRSNVTLGGFATTDEMCVTYLHYYPRVDLEVCKSSIDSRALRAYFDYTQRQEGDATSGQRKSVAQNYHSMQWSKRKSYKLLELYNEAPLSSQCNKSNGARHAGNWNGLPPTKLWSPQQLVESIVGESSTLEQAASPFHKSGEQLAAYRGLNYRRRHESCGFVA